MKSLIVSQSYLPAMKSRVELFAPCLKIGYLARYGRKVALERCEEGL